MVILLIHSCLLAYAASRHSPAVDEVGHLAAGLSHWRFGRFDLYAANPPLVRLVATLPLVNQDADTNWTHYSPDPSRRAEFAVAQDILAANHERSIRLFVIARLACIPFSLVGALVCYLWARELYGRLAGVVALSLWCFSPSILGYGQMITPDVGATAFGAAACYVYRRWLNAPSIKLAVVAGLVLGLAELTKFTWIILFGIWPILWLASRWHLWRLRPLRDQAAEAVQLLVVLFVAVCMINAFYGFEGSFRQLGEYGFVSKTLTGPSHVSIEGSTGNRFQNTAYSALPVPLPTNYLLGMDVTKRDFERQTWSYLLGEWKRGGWWYYYLVALAVKVPLGGWLLMGFATVQRATNCPKSDTRFEEWSLLVPAVVVFLFVSTQTGINEHMRYVLPIFPFAIIWTSRCAAIVSTRFRRQQWLFLTGCLTAFVVSSLSCYPHSLSYFNVLAGGARGGNRVLVGSNLDWGQDLLFLKQWLNRHPSAQPLGFAYYGEMDPRILGIEFSIPPSGPDESGAVLRENANFGPCPGWYAVSVSVRNGYPCSIHDGRGGWRHLNRPAMQYFQRFEPVAMAGYSIYIYQLDRGTVERVRIEMKLPNANSSETQN